MKKAIIYMYTSPSGKSYIGQTWNQEKRRQDHLGRKSKCPAFQQAIKKYGKDSFVFTVLHCGITCQKELDRLEALEISSRDTIAPNGYNLKPGGGGGKHHESSIKKMKEHWKNNRAQMVKAMKKAAESPEAKNRLRQNAIDNAADPQIRRKKSESLKKAFSDKSVREKRSKQRKLEWANPEIRKKRIDGLKKAQESKEYKKKLSQAMRERWKCETYKQEMKKKRTGKKRPQSAIEATRQKRMVKVVCVETGQLFESVSAAAAFSGASRTCISSVLTGKRKTAAGYTWRYADNDDS